MWARGSRPYRRAARASASGGVDLAVGMIFNSPLAIVTSGGSPSFALASILASRLSRKARRPAIERSKSISTMIGGSPFC
jgi:hypothetical protein